MEIYKNLDGVIDAHFSEEEYKNILNNEDSICAYIDCKKNCSSCPILKVMHHAVLNYVGPRIKKKTRKNLVMFAELDSENDDASFKIINNDCSLNDVLGILSFAYTKVLLNGVEQKEDKNGI